LALSKIEIYPLKEQDEKGKIDYIYLDKNGLSLILYIPSVWQEKAVIITVKNYQSEIK